MKPSRLAQQKSAFALEAQTHAANVFRVALADLTDARPGESLKEAFGRAIDARIRDQRWYRRLWRWITRFPLGS